MKCSEVGDPVLGDVVATGFDPFLANFSAKLLQKSQPVRFAPFFRDLAAHYAKDFNPRYPRLLTGRGDPHILNGCRTRSSEQLPFPFWQACPQQYPLVDNFGTSEWPKASDLNELIVGSRG